MKRVGRAKPARASSSGASAPALSEKIISTLQEYVGEIERLRQASPTELWYRGHSRTTYTLAPTLFRHPKLRSMSQVFELENNILTDFVFRSPSFLSSQERDRWDTLFLMQHYRIPTRLLDWTSSPFAGLFFALDTNDETSDATLWVFDPCEWNRCMLQDIGTYDRVFTTDDQFLDQYHPGKRGKTVRAEPLAVHGMVNNPRMNAQKGKFVVFGQKVAAMETFMTHAPNWQRQPLVRLTIPADRVSALRWSVYDFGMTHTSIYPDLEGLALELRFKYGF